MEQVILMIGFGNRAVALNDRQEDLVVVDVWVDTVDYDLKYPKADPFKDNKLLTQKIQEVLNGRKVDRVYINTVNFLPGLNMDEPFDGAELAIVSMISLAKSLKEDCSKIFILSTKGFIATEGSVNKYFEQTGLKLIELDSKVAISAIRQGYSPNN